MNNISNELKILIPLVKNTGDQILKIYNSDFSHKLKDDQSPLTKADLLSEKMLLEGLKQFNYGFVSEETAENNINYEKVWIIDPLDGTKDFIQKTDEFSIMIALLENKKPVLGIVCVPALDKIYYAQEGNGAFLIEAEKEPYKLKVSKEDNIEKFRVVRSRNHFSREDQEVANNLNVNSFKKSGSVGVKFGEIAEGNAHLCYYTTDGLGIWDCAASHIILKEAGGDVFNVDGVEPIYNLESKKMKKGFIGSNGINKEKILNAIQKSKHNIRKEETHITKKHRRDRNKHHSLAIWFTGLSGSGKSTLAKEVEKKLFDLGVNVYVLDGDNLRFGLNKDLGFSLKDREENIRRVSELSKLFVDSGNFVMSAFISPYKKDRDFARELFDKDEFIEIYVRCPIEVCETRDVKGLYKKARKGEIKGFTGIDDPYEEPENPDLIIDTDNLSIEESIGKIINYLSEKSYI